MATVTRLRESDVVSVAVATFGEEYARSRWAAPWTCPLVRDEGRIVGKRDGKWLIKFDSLNEPAVLLRKVLQFVSRPANNEPSAGTWPGSTRRTTMQAAGDSDEVETAPENADDCSSDSTPDDGDAVPAVKEAKHDGGQ
eukprot:4544442-Pleurochrysis_carterae.AAC.1